LVGKHLVCIFLYPSEYQAHKVVEGSVALFGADHEFTKLIINHKGVDPEDAFSSIPYEKGFHFLYYLDRLVGREHFDKFIPHYFEKWARKSLDSFQFKQTFLDFFENYGDDEIKQKIAQIPWEDRFYSPGLPPKPEFNTAYVDSCLALAEKWKQEVRGWHDFASELSHPPTELTK
jgi:leukotriene-A4 hydrolase